LSFCFSLGHLYPQWPVGAFAWDLGTLSSGQNASRHLTIAYDDIYSIKYYGTNFEPYWQHSKGAIEDLLTFYASNYQSILDKSTSFDNSLLQTVTSVGGDKYATV